MLKITMAPKAPATPMEAAGWFDGDFMTHLHPLAFKGMKKKDPKKCYWAGDNVVCPKCKGYGGWHLHLDAYGPGKHFEASCGNCNGWGWVKAGSLDATCIHEYEEIGGPGLYRCEHRYKCTKCGREIIHDSSD